MIEDPITKPKPMTFGDVLKTLLMMIAILVVYAAAVVVLCYSLRHP